jgi:fluoride exporter
MIKTLLLIGLGSFIGGIGRFALGRYVQSTTHSLLPWGTFTVNVLGCLLIGILFGVSLKSDALTTSWKLFLIIGICGGFTTFSTFSLENLELLRNGNILHFFVYTVMSVAIGLLATFGGYMITRIW